MDKVINPKTPFMDRSKSLRHSMRIKDEAIKQFESMANIGNEENVYIIIYLFLSLFLSLSISISFYPFFLLLYSYLYLD